MVDAKSLKNCPADLKGWDPLSTLQLDAANVAIDTSQYTKDQRLPVGTVSPDSFLSLLPDTAKDYFCRETDNSYRFDTTAAALVNFAVITALKPNSYWVDKMDTILEFSTHVQDY